ncbi:MAG: amidohydrolase family protein [Opitutaceae bacterium]|nr:amidohydrolase family protein [Opitutaceae bacterium]
MNAAAHSPGEIARVLQGANNQRIWLNVGRLFDGHQNRGPCHIVLDRHTILHVGSSPPPLLVRPGQISPDLDLPDHTALPGLIEAHGHLFLEGGELDPDRRASFLKLSPEEFLARAELRLKRLLSLGIVAVRDAGDRNGVGLVLQRRCESSPSDTRPHIESPGAAIHHQGRYGAFMATPLEADGGIEAAVSARVAQGARHIKLLATGIINFEKGAVTAKPQMPSDELARAVAAARSHGRQTMVHCSGNDGVTNCIAARVDTIEHGYFIDRDQLARLRDLDIAWVPTFAPVQFQADHAGSLGWSPAVRDNLLRILDDHAARLADAGRFGVKVIAGSDAGSHGVPHGHGFLHELELMERAGLSAERVLRSATGDAADRLHLSEPGGRLAPGRRPRFILTGSPVLDSVRHLRSPSIVFFDGTVFTDGDDPFRPGM